MVLYICFRLPVCVVAHTAEPRVTCCHASLQCSGASLVFNMDSIDRLNTALMIVELMVVCQQPRSCMNVQAGCGESQLYTLQHTQTVFLLRSLDSIDSAVAK